MACTKEEIQERIRSTAVMRDGKTRFTGELRSDILEYSKGRIAEGQTWNSVAVELGMNAWTLSRWHQKPRKPKAVVASFVEVSQKAAEPGTSARARGTAAAEQRFEVVCPSGFEVRVPVGFEVASLRQLIQVLERR